LLKADTMFLNKIFAVDSREDGVTSKILTGTSPTAG
jgi:hypothetical protein